MNLRPRFILHRAIFKFKLRRLKRKFKRFQEKYPEKGDWIEHQRKHPPSEDKWKSQHQLNPPEKMSKYMGLDQNREHAFTACFTCGAKLWVYLGVDIKKLMCPKCKGPIRGKIPEEKGE